MIAVSFSSFKKSGCVNCGSDYCNGDALSINGTGRVICGECHTDFVVLPDGITKSGTGYGTGMKDENGKDIYEYPILQEHPRKDIEKHKYVRPDIRPEDGIGDFCSPRGLGYDLACFVKSKEAGQRITDMINKINKEYKNKGFNCWLDYREYEPNWIQVKINYPNELRGLFLSGLIRQNNNIITEDIVRKAMDMEVNFENYWKYKANAYVYNNVQLSFLNKIIGLPSSFTKKQRDEIYGETFQNNNYLDQFEVWGAYNQINLELENGNLENAVALAKHLIESIKDEFNYELALQQYDNKRDYITDIRKSLHHELIDTVNNHYKSTNQLDKIIHDRIAYKRREPKSSINLSLEQKQQFMADFEEIAATIFTVIDLNVLKAATNYDEEKIEESEKIVSENYSDLYMMFQLFGLYVQVSRNIEQGEFENAVLAMQHTASQMNSPLFKQIQTSRSNDDFRYMMMQVVYSEISNIASKYCGEQTTPGTRKRLTINK